MLHKKLNETLTKIEARFEKDNRWNVEIGGNGGGAGMVGLGAAAGQDGVGAGRKGIRHNEFQLPDLVPGEFHSGEVVPLDVNLDAEAGAEGRQRVRGIQGQLWAENSTSPEILDYQTFPKLLGLAERATHWREVADSIHREIDAEAWSDEAGAFTEAFGRPELDASLLLVHELDFVSADDPRFRATLEAVEKQLRRGNHLFRYAAADDFGEPENAFNICTFWYIDALAAAGRRDEARELFEHMLSCRNSLGLLSEDIDPTTGELWGNFPQTYSMVGIINAAARLSVSWEDAL